MKDLTTWSNLMCLRQVIWREKEDAAKPLPLRQPPQLHLHPGLIALFAGQVISQVLNWSTRMLHCLIGTACRRPVQATGKWFASPAFAPQPSEAMVAALWFLSATFLACNSPSF
jgi:hypothetical protein